MKKKVLINKSLLPALANQVGWQLGCALCPVTLQIDSQLRLSLWFLIYSSHYNVSAVVN
jgi:hypothetical protein